MRITIRFCSKTLKELNTVCAYIAYSKLGDISYKQLMAESYFAGQEIPDIAYRQYLFSVWGKYVNLRDYATISTPDKIAKVFFDENIGMSAE